MPTVKTLFRLPIASWLALALATLLSACTSLPGLAAPTSTPTATPTLTPTATPTATPSPTATATPTPVPLTLAVRLEPATVPQGELATLLIEPSRPASLSATLDGQPLPLHEEDGRWYGLIAVWAGTPAGRWPLEITASDPLGGRPATAEGELTISGREFTIDYVELSPETVSLLDPEKVRQETELMEELLAPRTPVRLWEGPFLRPVGGVVTSTYGQRRSYNGGPATEYHAGLDLGIDEGTPIVAANSGRVVFAGALTVRGNCVIIDHGWGLYSGYYHMSAIQAEAGQQVSQGEVIGLVGSTGMSTGPHLHWSVWLNGDAIDPTCLESWELPR